MSESNTTISVSNSAQAHVAVSQAEGLAEVGGAPTASPVTSATKINSLEELRLLDPKLYKMMLTGIVQNMMVDFNRHQQRVKTAMKKLVHGNN
jgi:hypothetical protein